MPQKGSDCDFETFTLNGDDSLRLPMEKYMKNLFPFAGVKAPQRKEQSAPLIKRSKQLPVNELLMLIDNIYKREEREYQYVAIDICIANVKRFSFSEVKVLAQYVLQKPWWDSVDAWRKLFGKYVQLNPAEKTQVFNLFYENRDFWMRRISILLQLLEMKTLNKELLSRAILYDRETAEFFIQKAIGWALRNYSKYNPDWVSGFISGNALSALAVKEASVYLKDSSRHRYV